MTTESALATIRESFGRVVYTHKTHLKMIDSLNARATAVKLANIIALLLTTGGILTPIFDALPFKNIVLSLCSAFALGVAVYQISFDPALEIEAHRKCAKHLWIIREKYINLIADIKDGFLADADVRNQRDCLVDELGKIYQEAPDTRPRAYKAARKALKINQEMTFSSQEIDLFLPVRLRENQTTP